MKLDISGLASSPKKLALALLLSALFGAIWFVLIRAVTIDANGPHYHANFALFINGEREPFAEGTFYEEVAACGGEENDPLARVHLHDQISDVVHVHDASATWGNFFENLGFTLGNNVMYARATTYVNSDDARLSFVLNGEQVRSIAAKTIQDEDVLLVSYGTENSEELMAQYDQITQNASEYNAVADPAACAGTQYIGYFDRIKLVLGID